MSAEVIRKTKFAWASIAGADAEPVELIETDGRQGLLTIGCQDPFWLDDPAAGIVIFSGCELVRPLNPETQEQRDSREAVYLAKKLAVRAAYLWHKDHAAHGPYCLAGDCNGKPYRHMWRGPR